jgi:hypothetical protein
MGLLGTYTILLPSTRDESAGPLLASEGGMASALAVGRFASASHAMVPYYRYTVYVEHRARQTTDEVSTRRFSEGTLPRSRRRLFSL